MKTAVFVALIGVISAWALWFVQTEQHLRESTAERFEAHKKGLQAFSNSPRTVLTFKNGCKEPVWVAISYTALDGVEEVHGWYHVSTGESPNLATRMAGSNFYYYAHTTPAHLEWKGGDGAKKLFIVDVAFQYLVDSFFYNDGVRIGTGRSDKLQTKYFRKAQMPSVGAYEIPCGDGQPEK